MTNVQHVEPLVDAAIASLRASLNLRIDEINLEETDFELAHVPLDAYKAGGLASTVAVSWPFVEVSVSDATYTEPTVRQIAWNRAAATMYVALWCRHVDDEALYRSTLRYGRAMLAVLLTADTFGTNVYVDSARVAYRRNPETGTAEAFEAAALFSATIIGDELSG